MNHSTAHCMYYVAIVCPTEINERALQFKHWMKEQFGCVVALKSPAHITLIPPFWMDEARESDLKQSLNSFKSDIADMEISLEGISHFGKKVLFINVKDNPTLSDIRSQVENHFIHSFGDVIKKNERPFHPHITIANRDIKPGDFDIAWEHFSNKKIEESFQVGNISLLRLWRNEFNWDIILSNEW